MQFVDVDIVWFTSAPILEISIFNFFLNYYLIYEVMIRV